MSVDLYKVLTLPEAAKRWHKSETLIHLALKQRKKFEKEKEEGLVRQSGATWLIHYDAMVRVFGEEPVD